MTYTQLFGLEALVCVIEMQFVLRYYNSVYGVAKYTKKLRLLSIPYILAITSVLKLCFLHPGGSASLPINTVLASFIFLPFLPGRWEKKMLFSIILVGVSLAWTHFSDLVTSLAQFTNLWANYMGFHAGFWALLELLKRIGKKEYQHITKAMWFLLIAIASLSTFVCYTIAVTWQNSPLNYIQTSDFVVLPAFVLINCALFLFFAQFSELLLKVKEQSLLEQQVALQDKHHKELTAYQKQIASLHHDMRNYIGVAVSLSRCGNTNTELERYLQSISGKLEQIEETVATGNPSIDSVLNLKLSQLQYAGVSCETDIHIPAGLSVSFDDSVIILGNLLDNAREACEALPEQARWVFITISYGSGALYIKVDNPFASQSTATEDTSLPQTTKSNQTVHGYGLKNIVQTVEHRGAVKIDRSKPGVFSIRVMLYDL